MKNVGQKAFLPWIKNMTNKVYNILHLGNATEEGTILDKLIPNCLNSMVSNRFEENLSEDQGMVESQDFFGWVVEGPLIFIAFLVGVVGNGFSVVVFSRQKVHRIFHHLLLLLSIFDMVSEKKCGFILCFSLYCHFIEIIMFYPFYMKSLDQNMV